jgi:hypothetical protein
MRMEAKTDTRFSLSAPTAREVLLVGDFTAWAQRPVPLKREVNGVWQASILLEPGRHEYRFVVDGCWSDDPQCSLRIPNDFGSVNCVCVVEPPVIAPKLAARPRAVPKRGGGPR